MPQTYWKRVVAVFFAGWLLVYANRTVIGPLLPVLQDIWGLSKTQLGMINSAFFLTYTLVQLPSGFLADRFGRKLILVPGYIGHALGAFASALAPGPWAFTGARVFTGFGQGTFYSTHNALASMAIPQDRRGMGVAIMNSGVSFGIALGWLSAGFLTSGLGWSWRVPLLLLAGITLAVATAMGMMIREHRAREPENAARNPDNPARELIGAGTGTLRSILTPDLVRIYVVNIMMMYGFFAILTWLPYYLKEVRGLTGSLPEFLSIVMPFVSLPAGIGLSRFSDLRGGRSRILTLAAPLAGLALFLIVAVPTVPGLVVALALYGLAGKMTIEPLLVATIADLTVPEVRGRVYGLCNFLGTISTVLAPAITGALADLTGSFDAGFYLAAGLHLIALAAAVGIRENRARAGVVA